MFPAADSIRHSEIFSVFCPTMASLLPPSAPRWVPVTTGWSVRSTAIAGSLLSYSSSWLLKQLVLWLSTSYSNKLEPPPCTCLWDHSTVLRTPWGEQMGPGQLLTLCPTLPAACSNHNLGEFSAIHFSDPEHKQTMQQGCAEELRSFPRGKTRRCLPSFSSELSSLLDTHTFTSQPQGKTQRSQDQVIWRWNEGWERAVTVPSISRGLVQPCSQEEHSSLCFFMDTPTDFSSSCHLSANKYVCITWVRCYSHPCYSLLKSAYPVQPPQLNVLGEHSVANPRVLLYTNTLFTHILGHQLEMTAE